MLGRLLLLLMFAISSSSASVIVVLLHSQVGGGFVVQSQGVELAPAAVAGLVGFELLKAW